MEMDDQLIEDAFRGLRERVYTERGGLLKEWPCGCRNSDDGRGQVKTRYCVLSMCPVFIKGVPHGCARREEERGGRY